MNAKAGPCEADEQEQDRRTGDAARVPRPSSGGLQAPGPGGRAGGTRAGQAGRGRGTRAGRVGGRAGKGFEHGRAVCGEGLDDGSDSELL